MCFEPTEHTMAWVVLCKRGVVHLTPRNVFGPLGPCESGSGVQSLGFRVLTDVFRAYRAHHGLGGAMQAVLFKSIVPTRGTVWSLCARSQQVACYCQVQHVQTFTTQGASSLYGGSHQAMYLVGLAWA
jgi:hypothetical protein